MARLTYKIPTRSLLGFRSQFMTDTKGLGIMNYVFAEYGPYAGEIVNRVNGVLVSMETCTTVAYALFNLQERGRLFLGPGIKIYKGQIIGENARSTDMVVNPAKGKKLTNMRASGSDENVVLTPPVNTTTNWWRSPRSRSACGKEAKASSRSAVKPVRPRSMKKGNCRARAVPLFHSFPRSFLHSPFPEPASGTLPSNPQQHLGGSEVDQ
jgi:hypothetical protein